MELLIKSKGVFYTCLYSECDKDFISSHTWHISGTGYVSTNVMVNGKKTVMNLHRMLMLDQIKGGMVIDHINRNKLDNRRENLRVCTRAENNRNVDPYGKSGYLGVVYNISRSRKGVRAYIKAQIKVDKKNISLGNFKTEKEAAMARDRAALKYYGASALLNFPNSRL